MTRQVDHALRYAALGYRVLPTYVIKDSEGRKKKVSASKAVCVARCPEHRGRVLREAVKVCRKCVGGHAGASTSEKVIRFMWGERPKALVGLLPPRGVLILDDDSHVFDVVWRDMPRVRSVSGKHHYWFRLGPEQKQPPSENGIVFKEPDGVVDIRGPKGGLWIMAPSGRGGYRGENGWNPDPARLPVLPRPFYDRLVAAPRVDRTGGGGGGPGGSKFVPGLDGVVIGNWYDRQDGAIEDVLERHGWEDIGSGRWTRPGGTQSSATLGERRSGIRALNVFTSSAEPLQSGHFYTASMLRAVLDHDGNWAACDRALHHELMNG